MSIVAGQMRAVKGWMPMSDLGQKRTHAVPKSYVRFTPGSGHMVTPIAIWLSI
jgi:hypothetical protein